MVPVVYERNRAGTTIFFRHDAQQIPVGPRAQSEKPMKRIHVLILLLVLSAGLFVFFQVLGHPGLPAPVRAAGPNWLVKKYGPKHFSQNDEELIIRDFFEDRKNGFFVDVGANHYRTNSTTYYLEKYLEWGGIAVDAICDFKKEYELYRPKTLFFCFFIADRSDDRLDFYINRQNRRVSTGVEDLARKQGPFDKQKAATITLNDLLRRAGVEQFDFLSMDIELAEPAALAGFDIRKYRPLLVCIEAHEEVRRQILEYFTKNRYQMIHAYDGLDPLNCYFTPAGAQVK
jgi:FkbM family methyltransferase